MVRTLKFPDTMLAILLGAPRESPEVQEIVELSCLSGRKSRWELGNPK